MSPRVFEWRYFVETNLRPLLPALPLMTDNSKVKRKLQQLNTTLFFKNKRLIYSTD